MGDLRQHGGRGSGGEWAGVNGWLERRFHRTDLIELNYACAGTCLRVSAPMSRRIGVMLETYLSA